METQHLYVDEAGDTELFQPRYGKVIVGTPGCSRYFFMGKLEVDDPVRLTNELNALRQKLLGHPYFSGVESFRPERKKTAVLFHAKDDVPEVRFLVFDLLRSFGTGIRFHAVVRDKQVLANEEIRKRQMSPGYRYDSNGLYDSLVRSLFGKFHRLADEFQISIAKRGQRDRNAALQQALAHAEADFERKFGFQRGGEAKLTISNPVKTVCLQAVDYFLWAVQRFYEVRFDPSGKPLPHEERFLKTLQEQIVEIHDLDFGAAHGTYFTPQNPLSAEKRFPEKKKKP